MAKFHETTFSEEESPMIYGWNSIQDKLKLQDLKLISFTELSRATDSFSSLCKLGEGGFGAVYMVIKFMSTCKILNSTPWEVFM